MNSIANNLKLKNYRQKIEKEFYDSFKWFLRVNQVFCSAPINILFSSQEGIEKENKRLKIRDKIIFVFHTLCAITISTSVVMSTYFQYKDFDTSFSSFMTKILYIGEYIMTTMNIFLIVVSCQYQKKEYCNFFHRLVNVDLRLYKCGIKPDFECSKIFLSRSMKTYTIFFGSVVVVDFMYNQMDVKSFFRSSTVFSVPNIIIVFTVAQYSAVLHYIKTKYKAMNAAIRRLVLNNNLKDHFLINNNVNILSIISMNQDKLRVDKILNVMRKDHSELLRLMELLNECFGILIITTFCTGYITLSIQFYAFYKMSEGFEPSDIWLILYSFLWVILHGGKVILFLYSVHDVFDEQRRTGNFLYEMNFVPKDKNSEGIIFAIKAFGDQLLQERQPPNALRVVNLDLTIVGTVNKYLMKINY